MYNKLQIKEEKNKSSKVKNIEIKLNDENRQTLTVKIKKIYYLVNPLQKYVEILHSYQCL